MRVWLMVSAAVLLTSCGEAPEQETTGEEVPTQTATETPMPVEPDGGIGDGAIPLDEAQAIANNEIPARFHGVWDYVEGTCALESDLRMEISAGEIMFYESFGKVKSAKQDGEDITLTLVMEGEGEVWETEYYLNLSDEDDLLAVRYKWGDRASDTLPRKRCPS